MKTATYLLIVLFVLITSACAVSPAAESPAADGSPQYHAGDGPTVQRTQANIPPIAKPSDGPLNWHAVRFRMPRNDQGQPVWAMDLLLADQVLSPQITEHHLRLRQWRFHRRAGNDATGHQFSWLFFTDDVTAEAIFNAVPEHWVVKQALEKGKLTRVLTQKNAYPNSENIAATSDPRWSAAMQQHWPAYMTGVSQLWLGLVQSYTRANTDVSDLTVQLDHYQAANLELNQLWREQGQHALLHHLSAAFGYQPLFFGNLIQF